MSPTDRQRADPIPRDDAREAPAPCGVGEERAARGVRLDELAAELERAGERLGPAAIAYVGHRLARELGESHAALDDEGVPAPLLHGAVRPSVVLITGDGEVRLQGFGDVDRGSPAEDVYRAPELAAGARLTPRADVFALAAIIARLVDDGRDGASMGAAVWPAEVAEALRVALEPAPARRRMTCVELEEWLATAGDLEAGRREIVARLAARAERIAEGASREAERGGEPRARVADDSRPLTPLGAVLVAVTTAAVVIAAGVLAMELARRP